MKLSVLHEDNNVSFVVDIRYIEVVSYLHDCLVFVQKPQCTSLLICTWLPTCQWLPLSYFFIRIGSNRLFSSSWGLQCHFMVHIRYIEYDVSYL